MANSRINFFYSSGRLYGIAFRVRGRLHVLGICRRGIFWRFNANIHQPVPGFWESMFGVRYSIGNTYLFGTGIRLLLPVGMRDENITFRCRLDRVRGGIRYSRTGCISIKFAELDMQIYSPLHLGTNRLDTSNQMEANRDNESSEE